MKKTARTIGILQLLNMIPDETAAVKMFEAVRWTGGVKCPRCSGDNIKSDARDNFYRCTTCRRRFTVRMGTVMESSRIPVQKWLIAMYLLLTARKGVSSLQISKELHITQKSAWFMVHRLREACISSGILSGTVEIDETYIGGKEINKHSHKKLNAGRGTVGKLAVMGLRQRGGKVIAMPVNSTDKETLQNIVADNVADGSTVYSDDHRSYIGLGTRKEFRHGVVKHSVAEWVNGMAHTNGIESVWAVLKRGYHGTHHHMSSKHLHRYVNEFTFRLNDADCQTDTIDRLYCMMSAMIGKRITYKQLTS